MTRSEAIPVQAFDAGRAAAGLFSPEIENHPGIVFHGTSCVNSGAIESEGFHCRNHALSRDDLEKVLAVFEEMQWSGEDQGGFGVLKSFSANDFRIGRDKFLPTFFTLFSQCAVWYATKEMAGGEKMRAVRRAIADLKLYLLSEDVRSAHFKSMQSRAESLIRLGAAGPAKECNFPVSIDLDWLAAKIADLGPIYEVAEAAEDEFSGGVVYAVEVKHEDFSNLVPIGTDCIAALHDVPADKIVAKASIPADFHYDKVKLQPDVDLRLKRTNSHAVMAAIRESAYNEVRV